MTNVLFRVDKCAEAIKISKYGLLESESSVISQPTFETAFYPVSGFICVIVNVKHEIKK